MDDTILTGTEGQLPHNNSYAVCNYFQARLHFQKDYSMNAIDMAESTSPLLRLPLEIRLMIYEYLLLPSRLPSASHATSVANLLPDFHTYHFDDTNDAIFTLAVRTMDPYSGAQSSRSWKRRSTYHVRTGKPRPSPAVLFLCERT